MLKNKLMIALLAASGLMFSAAASAQVYVGGTVGKASWSEDCTGLDGCTTNSSAYKILGGYNINDKFAVEASYFSLGTVNGTQGTPGGLNAYNLKGTGFELSGLYNQALTDKLTGFAKVGVARIKASNNYIVQDAPGSDSTTSTAPVFGVGLTYKLTDKLALRSEVETRKIKYNGDKEAVTNYSVGMQYSF